MTEELRLEGSREGEGWQEPTALDERCEYLQQNGGIRKHHRKVTMLGEGCSTNVFGNEGKERPGLSFRGNQG